MIIGFIILCKKRPNLNQIILSGFSAIGNVRLKRKKMPAKGSAQKFNGFSFKSGQTATIKKTKQNTNPNARFDPILIEVSAEDIG